MDFLITPNIKRDIEDNEDFRNMIFSFVKRFQKEDWGDLSENDKRLNDETVSNNIGRIIASYTIPKELQNGNDEKVWIIQYLGENVTAEEMSPMILYPSEY